MSFERTLDVRKVDDSDRVEVEEDKDDSEWSEVLLVSHTLAQVLSFADMNGKFWDDGQQST